MWIRLPITTAKNDKNPCFVAPERCMNHFRGCVLPQVAGSCIRRSVLAHSEALDEGHGGAQPTWEN